MSHTSFLGIPVEGTITESDRVPQRPLSELQPLLRALLDDETITEFGWRQFTPYFNDGEPCVFGLSDFWVRTTGDTEVTDLGLLEVGEYAGTHPTLGGHAAESHGWQYGPYRGDQPERYHRARALADALHGNEFADVLLDAFGDHAEVTVRRTNISVEFYDHE
ncbi:hypothetical protein [Catellatospora tritici]|uniref:hypothetical protein n=1 Tax=Catellatospora tritici TaxID=2851566 RepID=UPI001C2D7F2F|nr:hypothetical protein [Catellatospora tritici]MBV1848517.1 hypothetical protein [Catellatospora tritici]MBV1851463.1 hypothetical protein [Catellatospora tritici]